MILKKSTNPFNIVEKKQWAKFSHEEKIGYLQDIAKQSETTDLMKLDALADNTLRCLSMLYDERNTARYIPPDDPEYIDRMRENYAIQYKQIVTTLKKVLSNDLVQIVDDNALLNLEREDFSQCIDEITRSRTTNFLTNQNTLLHLMLKQKLTVFDENNNMFPVYQALLNNSDAFGKQLLCKNILGQTPLDLCEMFIAEKIAPSSFELYFHPVSLSFEKLSSEYTTVFYVLEKAMEYSLANNIFDTVEQQMKKICALCESINPDVHGHALFAFQEKMQEVSARLLKQQLSESISEHLENTGHHCNKRRI